MTELERITPRKTRIGLVAGGLGAYWPQFPDLLPQLQASARRVSERFAELDCEVVDVGFISDAQEGAVAAEKLRVADCDLIVGFLTTYMTASMLVPVAQRSGAPVLLLNLQPTEAMDHATFDTGAWLAYCGACPLPEMANAFERCGVDFRSVSGYLEDERAWARIDRWIRAAGVRAGRSPSCRRSTSTTTWSRWAMTGRLTSRSARPSPCCVGSGSITASGAGACPSSST
jgi:L-arabinose isomerase